MLYIKKYFTEGLIQMAILLSLCGVRVDVGLEPYLPSSWHERILGPSLALTQTQFHNLRNSLEDGYGLHPKSVDLDSFFTARRLLGWVHSLNRLQSFLLCNNAHFLSLGLLGSLRQPEQTMLPLAPSADLDDPSSAFSNSNVNTLHSPPDHTDLLAEDFSMGLNAEDNLSAFNMNLLMPDLVDTVESSPCVHCVPHPEHLAGFDVNCHSCDITPSSFATSLEGNDMTQEFQTSPSSLFLVDKEEDFEDEDDHPLDDLLDDVAMLDDIRLLDLALDEGFSPEMAARLEEEGYLDHEGAQQKTDDHSVSDSSSSCLSAVGSPFSRDRDYDAEEGLVGSDMEVEIMDRKLFNDFSWQEDIDHDHTYNQPWFSTDAFSRDEWHAQALKIPFSNELIVNLPVEDFNDLLTNFQLNEDQLTLIRDIRRRGKNKIAAQNCRKRKLDVLQGLEDEVSCLRRHRLWLLQEKQEARKKLQEMKRQLDVLYQEVFSRLRDENGRPLDTTEYLLQVGSSGNITVASHQQDALLPMRGQKNSKKQRGKKK
uniref:Endoplasmic reticulum membrane sensor NFE2L1 n=1 Tax=Anabas testudineus TaxID=64144 RepID=A0A3Q1I1C8_ANATE